MPLAEFSDIFPRRVEYLLRTRRTDRIGQAYLLVGDDDELLARFTTAWAQVCACLQPTDEGDACGECDCCRRLQHGTYPERIDLAPESKTRRILVDSMREFEHRLGLATDRKHLKIGVIADAECMGEEAQNAFLKTLEEPPRSTVLLLHTTQPKKLLPTIRSRCQNVPLLLNRRDYRRAIEAGLVDILAPLKRQQGAAVGLRAAAHLRALFNSLMKQAEECIGEAISEEWAEAAEQDKALTKRLEERREARVAAEYLRRRQDLEDGIHAWFLQQRLMAAGVDTDLLPHPELLQATQLDPPELVPESVIDAEENLRYVDTLLRALQTNISEDLALEAFCLSITEIRNTEN